MIYAGIGSKETPDKICELLKHIGIALADREHILRSGGAKGADRAFEIGCDIVGGSKEIYLPWKNFENNPSSLFKISDEAYKLGKKYWEIGYSNGNWDNVKPGTKKLMSRNIYQILGYDLKTPADFVVCYTKNGSGKGGTGQALRVAKDYNIPIFDFGKYTSLKEARNSFNSFYKEIGGE